MTRVELGRGAIGEHEDDRDNVCDKVRVGLYIKVLSIYPKVVAKQFAKTERKRASGLPDGILNTRADAVVPKVEARVRVSSPAPSLNLGRCEYVYASRASVRRAEARPENAECCALTSAQNFGPMFG